MRPRLFQIKRKIRLAGLVFFTAVSGWATPANKSGLKKFYGEFLAENLNRCTTCHLPSTLKNPESLDEFPHNPFGNRLRELGDQARTAGQAVSIAERLKAIRAEDSDGDGVPNEEEILLGSNPGVSEEKPTEAQLAGAEVRTEAFRQFLAAYQWEPFAPVLQPPVPRPNNSAWARNELDLFIAAGREKRGLKPRPEASPEILMRRAYVDLVGLNPTPEEWRAFLADERHDAYERLVDRLLEDPRYGERWGRHWMDVWRYSDWAGWSGGNQIRDSKPHIWRWRDWIVESLNADKPYSRMVVEMLAADELAPEDTDALRATGFLVRNYKMLSREQWLTDTLKHTSQAFLGLTIGCAKCHDHRTDPITQEEYYQLRAIFEPHQVRTDRVPGELDRAKNGLVRVYDVAENPPTYFFVRGDERHPDTNRVMAPGVPKALRGAGDPLRCESIELPRDAAHPDRREFVIAEQTDAARIALENARQVLAEAAGKAIPAAELTLALAETRDEILRSQLELEDLEEKGEKEGAAWQNLAGHTSELQKRVSVLEAKLKLEQARTAVREAGEKKKEVERARRMVDQAREALADAEKQFEKGWGVDYKPRAAENYPNVSTGRRLAFARWLASNQNPLTARVAVNHVWLRHFGRGMVTTPENFGVSGNPPSHPELLDWLAAEFMARGWSLKWLHRLILTSSTYRMASTPDDADLAIDPDNVYLWRMPSRRLDAELVRDNLLHAAGDLDPTMGGPDVDNQAWNTSKRRSLYLRIAAEKEVEFLKIFDGPAVTECYQRHVTVMPQQALALANSQMARARAHSLAGKLVRCDTDESFLKEAFERILAREPGSEEEVACLDFLRQHEQRDRARENLVLVLFNHNDFITVR